MKKLYKFYEDCGRLGELSGLFFVSEKEEEKLKKCYGQLITFYECLGKHSEVSVEITENNLSLLTDDQNFLERANELNIDLEYGINILNHIE